MKEIIEDVIETAILGYSIVYVLLIIFEILGSKILIPFVCMVIPYLGGGVFAVFNVLKHVLF